MVYFITPYPMNHHTADGKVISFAPFIQYRFEGGKVVRGLLAVNPKSELYQYIKDNIPMATETTNLEPFTEDQNDVPAIADEIKFKQQRKADDRKPAAKPDKNDS